MCYANVITRMQDVQGAEAPDSRTGNGESVRRAKAMVAGRVRTPSVHCRNGLGVAVPEVLMPALAGRPANRIGLGTMQLTGRGAFGPPRDRDEAIAVLRRAVDLGVNHIDTAHYYGPGVTNELIRSALHPYPDDLVLVSKVGAARDENGGWHEAQRPDELRAGVMANLRELGIESMPVVNLRRHPGTDVPFPEQLDAMHAMRAEGLIEAVGISNVTVDEYQAARVRGDVACVQNLFNLLDRSDQHLFDVCAADGIPYVPFFPLRSPRGDAGPVTDAEPVKEAADRLGTTPAQVALAWLLRQAPNVLLIPGTSSVEHLEENVASVGVELDPATIRALEELA